jgi:hypothetical protein
LEKVMAGTSFLDIRLWELLNGSSASICDAYDLKIKQRETDDDRGLIFDDYDDILYLGIKGMPGRGGIGSGHNFGNHYKKDLNYVKLKSWLRDDFKFYEKYLGAT